MHYLGKIRFVCMAPESLIWLLMLVTYRWPSGVQQISHSPHSQNTMEEPFWFGKLGTGPCKPCATRTASVARAGEALSKARQGMNVPANFASLPWPRSVCGSFHGRLQWLALLRHVAGVTKAMTNRSEQLVSDLSPNHCFRRISVSTLLAEITCTCAGFKSMALAKGMGTVHASRFPPCSIL